MEFLINNVDLPTHLRASQGFRNDNKIKIEESGNFFHIVPAPIALQSLRLLPKAKNFGVKDSDEDFMCPKKLIASLRHSVSTFRRPKS